MNSFDLFFQLPAISIRKAYSLQPRRVLAMVGCEFQAWGVQ
jgi:hypothetical protein